MHQPQQLLFTKKLNKANTNYDRQRFVRERKIMIVHIYSVQDKLG